MLKASFQPLWTQLVELQCVKAGIEDEYEIFCYMIYFQAGVITVLKYWLNTDCKKDEYEMLQILMNCIPNIPCSL